MADVKRVHVYFQIKLIHGNRYRDEMVSSLVAQLVWNSRYTSTQLKTFASNGFSNRIGCITPLSYQRC